MGTETTTSASELHGLRDAKRVAAFRKTTVWIATGQVVLMVSCERSRPSARLGWDLLMIEGVLLSVYWSMIVVAGIMVVTAGWAMGLVR